MEFKGKRVLVTGGARGIGKDITKTLIKAGAEVLVLGKTKDTIDAMQIEEPSIIPILVDLADWDATRKAIEEAGPIHLLCNNAAVSAIMPFFKITKDVLDRVYSVNIHAIVNVSQVVARGMIDRGEGGSIVNISSIASRMALPSETAYCSSKGALDSLTRVMAVELGPHKIRVNTIHPTIVMTDMGKRAWSDPAKSSKYLVRTPLGHFADPEDVAEGVVYLLSDRSKMVTGSTLTIDGGLMAN